MNIGKIKFDQQGLVPAVVQDDASGTVLMLAYMNEESLRKTLASGVTWFYSRSRKALWQKGETSGHVQKVKKIYYDCDGDTLLVASSDFTHFGPNYGYEPFKDDVPKKLAELGEDHFDANFYKGKIASAKFYIMNHVTDVFGFHKAMKAGDRSAIDVPEAALM